MPFFDQTSAPNTGDTERVAAEASLDVACQSPHPVRGVEVLCGDNPPKTAP
jgi:hypothetical protein